MPRYFDRYEAFRADEEIKPIPGLKINLGLEDKSVLYKIGKTRLDILSQKYYNNPYHGWLILLANPQYGGLEFEIKDRDVIRVPYPFEDAIDRYINSVNIYKELYG
tara:strand:- start:5425 stop:5742 length:318 start_codon:yes stop_codon:yes gene_type:complete